MTPCGCRPPFPGDQASKITQAGWSTCSSPIPISRGAVSRLAEVGLQELVDLSEPVVQRLTAQG